MKSPPFSVLYEDNHLLVVNKPAGLPTMGVAKGVPSLLSEAKEYIKQRYNKPGNVYLGIVSRLDAPVTGVLVIARTSKAAARLTEQFRNGDVKKLYWAVVDHEPDPPNGTCVDWVRKDERHRKMHVTRSGAEGAKEARLSYETLRSVPGGVLLGVRLETGRKHQIRLQLSQRGMPIVGDRKYGSRREFPNGIALHARETEFTHPVLKTTLQFVATTPKAWQRFGETE